MKKVLFAGCSYVSGNGFELSKEDPNLWVNLLHQHTQLKNFELVNAGRGGRSNAGIFQDAVWHISQGNIDIAVICWTSMPRYEMSLGLETYDTRAVFMPNATLLGHNLNDVNYSQSYLEGIRDRFTSLVHAHEEILNLVYYVNSLVNLIQITGTKVFFVNSLCPWDLNYFTKLEHVLPEDYTNFTKTLINMETREDQEIFQLYDKIHGEYQHAGGIQESHWLNLYQSLKSLQIDTNTDNVHPGINSNQQYYNLLNQPLISKL